MQTNANHVSLCSSYAVASLRSADRQMVPLARIKDRYQDVALIRCYSTACCGSTGSCS